MARHERQGSRMNRPDSTVAWRRRGTERLAGACLNFGAKATSLKAMDL
jgi:hypothetical protein